MEAHDVGATKGTEWVAGFPRREAGPEEGGAEVRARGRTTEVVSRTGNSVACSSSRAPKPRAKRKTAPAPDGPAADPARARKRVRDVASSGNNLDMERNVVRDFVDAWTGTFGENTAKVMNDSTKSDAIVRLTAKKDAWLRLQLKTTSGNNKKNSWAFRQVTGYSGMPVVCWRCDKKDAWVFDGAELHKRGIRDLAVTPGAENERKLALASGRKLADLVGDLAARARKGNADLWPTVTEDEARKEFKSKTHELEHLGFVAYIERNSKAGTYFSYPKDQGTHVDLLKVETRDDGKQVPTRLQFKTARKADRGGPGFMCNLRTCAGRSEGKQHYQPYPDDAFDELVVVAWVEDEAGKQKPKFWVIPAEALKEHRCLRSESGDVAGKTGLRLHSQDIGVQAKRMSPKTQWTSKFYVGKL